MKFNFTNRFAGLQLIPFLFLGGFLIAGIQSCAKQDETADPSERTPSIEVISPQDQSSSDLNNDALKNCSRDCVVNNVKTYVSSIIEHQVPNNLLSDKIRITENGADIQAGEGVWKTISKVGGYQQIFVDSQLNDAVFFGAFNEGDNPLLLAIRVKFENQKIIEAEHLLSRPDPRNRLIYRHALTEPNAVYDEIVQSPSTRAALVAAGHAYFDGIAKSTDEGVPMDAHCNRRENGVLLLKNKNPDTEPCPIGFDRFNYITDVRDRRVAVVDEERGLILIWGFFDIPGNIPVAEGPWGPSDIPNPNGEPRVDTRKIPRSLYIAELFKVVDGKIRDIEAIMYNLDLGATSGWD